MPPKYRFSAVLVFLLVASLLPSHTCAAAAESVICQLMEAEPGLPAGEAPEVLSKQAQPGVPATPIIAWLDEQAPLQGILVCVHGLGLHKGTYRQFGERMATHGWGVYAMDVRGFGSFQDISDKPKVDFAGCLQDVSDVIGYVHKTHPGLPVFIVGESMGGGIALQVTAKHPDLVSGLISSVPAAERYHKTGDAVKVGIGILAGPSKGMNVVPIVVDRSTTKEDLKKEWLSDELARFNLAPVELMKFDRFMQDNHRMAKMITRTPVLMLQGMNDQLVKQSGNETLIAEIPSPDACLIHVGGSEHLILEEGQFDDGVIKAICDWLAAHRKT